MDYTIDKNLKQLYNDAIYINNNHRNKEGMITFYKYLITNRPIIEKAYKDFNEKATDESVLKMAQATGGQMPSITGRFINKKRVVDFYEMYVERIEQRLSIVESDLTDESSYEDDVEMTGNVFNTLMYFADTNAMYLKRELISNLSSEGVS